MAEGSKIKSDILTRVRLLYLLFFIAGAVLLVRIFYVQLFSVEIATNAEKIYGRIFHSQSIRAHRGSILARDGEPLATSILRYQVEMDFGSEGFDSLQTFHRQSDSLAKLLSAYFKDRSVAQYRNLFRTKRASNYKLVFLKDSAVVRSEGWFDRLVDKLRGEEMRMVKVYDTIRNHQPVKILPREIDYSEWQTLKKFPILNWNMGMTYNLVGTDNRIYAQAGLARRTIGEIKADRGDDYGIEKVYNDVLQGEDGEVMRQRIARGFYGRVVGGENRDAVDGDDVVTTIDVELQDIATRALREQVEAQQSAWGTTIVMEVATGDILAIANLDRMANGKYAEQKNRAIGARAEPGSTFKLAAGLALLEKAHMPTTQTYNSGDGKYIRVGNARVRDSHAGYSEVNLNTAFEQSLNGFFATATYEQFKDDPNVYTDYLKSIHLDKTVGLDAFGEPTPRLPVQGSALWTNHMTLAYLGYGYAVELTPLQTLTLYNAVANDGRMVAPRLVSEIRRGNRTIERFKPRVLVDKIASKSTIDTIQRYLVNICENGTAKQFLGQFEGFTAAGKTGTAQYSQDGLRYSDNYYLGTMVGYMPADKPKYSVITVILKRPGRGTTIYGGGMSGPVTQRVMQALYNREHGWHTRLDTIPQQSYPQKIKGGNVEAINKVVSTLTPHWAEHDSVRSEWGDASFDKERERVLVKGLHLKRGVVPNVYDMGLRDALFVLESCGYNVHFTGSGSVWRQSLRAGDRRAVGSSITINLR